MPPAVSLSGTVAVPPAIVAGIQKIVRAREAHLCGFDIDIEVRAVDGLLAALARAFQSMSSGGSAPAAVASADVHKIRTSGANIAWGETGASTPATMQVVDTGVRPTPDEQEAIDGTFQELARRMPGVRIVVEPKSAATYARDLLQSLETIEHQVWFARVGAPLRTLLTPSEADEMGALVRRVQGEVPLYTADGRIMHGVVSTLRDPATGPEDHRALLETLRTRMRRFDEMSARNRLAGSGAKRTAEEREAAKQTARAAHERRLADVAQAERRQVRERQAEVRAYQEDTRTGPRAKMPPALELDRIVQGPGAAFTVRNDPPKMLGAEMCGNPIDGHAYYFIVTKQTRSQTGFYSWAEVEALAAQAGIRPVVESQPVAVRASVAPAVVARAGIRTYYEARGVRLADLELDLLTARALVARDNQIVPDDAPIQVPREAAQTGIQVTVFFLAKSYLDALYYFIENTFLPANRKQAYLSTEAATHIGRLKTTAKARRGLKAPGGALKPQGLEKRSSVYHQAELLAGRHAEAEDVLNIPALALGGLPPRRPGSFQHADSDASKFDSNFSARETAGRSRAPRKATTATWQGDPKRNFAVYDAETGRLRFLRRTSKAALALEQFKALTPYAPRDFVALETAPLTEALVRASAREGSPVHQFVADMLITSACVRVNDSITLDPTAPVPAGAKITLRCEPKNSSPFFSWVPATLPASDVDADCITRDGQKLLLEQAATSPMNYLVFKTYNPILFESTRQMWVTRQTRSRMPWESVLAQFRLMQDIDIVGRFGVAAGFAQWAAVKVAPAARPAALNHLFAPAFQVRTLKELMSGNLEGARAFVQLWGLGTSLATARSDVAAFATDPVGWTRNFKRQRVDTAVPRLMRLAQIGIPATKAYRLRPSSSPDDLRTALYLAMTGAPPPGATSAEADATLLRRFQAQPPLFAARGAGGLMETMTAEPLPTTGTFDSVTVAMLNRVLNAPRSLPRGARPVPATLDLSQTTPGRVPGVVGPPRSDEQRAMLELLRDQVKAIDQALAALPPPPYRQRAGRQQDTALNIQRPGRKRIPGVSS
jgi:hypothetical protein